MANGEIIKAAGAAYNIPKVDISGFVKGFTAIATGLINSEKRKTTGQALLTKKSGNINTRFESYKNNAKIVRNDHANGVISLNEASERIDNLASGVTKLNELDQLSKTLYGDNGYSLDINPVDRAYLTAIRTGQLETPIIVDGVEHPALMAFDKKNHVYTLDQGGDKYRSTEEIINHFSQYATPKQADALVETANGFTSKNYTDEASWKAAAGKFKTSMDKSFKSNKLRNAFLLDNTLTIGIDNKRSFIDYYLDNSLFSDTEEGEKLNAEIKLQLDDPSVSKDEKELAKGLLVSQLMKSDKTIDEDVDKYINQIVEDKKPKKASEYVLGSEFNPSVNNPADFKLGRFSRAMSHMLKYDMSKKKYTGTFYKKADGDILATLTDYKVVFRKVANNDGNGKKLGPSRIQMYRQDGKENNVAIGNPFEASQEGVAKAMPSIKSALSMTESKAELTSAENYRLFLKNENNWDYLSNIYSEKRNYTNL
jgi:hypothetical protein